MKINNIKFLPATNAFADVCSQATGNAVVGMIVAAAAGNGDEPAPPTPTGPIDNVVVQTREYDNYFEIRALVTINQTFFQEHCGTDDFFLITLKDSNGVPIEQIPEYYSISGYFDYECASNVSDCLYGGEGSIGEFPEGGIYDISIKTVNQETWEEETIYEGSGNWTYEESFYFKNFSITKECSDYTIDATSGGLTGQSDIYVVDADQLFSCYLKPIEDGTTWVIDTTREYSFPEETDVFGGTVDATSDWFEGTVSTSWIITDKSATRFIASAQGYRNNSTVMNGNIDSNISFKVFGCVMGCSVYKSGVIHMATNGVGMRFNIANGYTVTGFKLKAVSGYTPNLKYQVGEEEAADMSYSDLAYSASNINATSTFSFYIDDENNRSLEIKEIKVYYCKEPQE